MKKFSKKDIGRYADGGNGDKNVSTRAIDMAKSFGFQEPEEMDDDFNFYETAEDAIAYLNEHCVTGDVGFCFTDGDLMLEEIEDFNPLGYPSGNLKKGNKMELTKEMRLNNGFWAGRLCKERNLKYRPHGIGEWQFNGLTGKKHFDKFYPIGYETGFYYQGAEPVNPYREGIFSNV